MEDGEVGTGVDIVNSDVAAKEGMFISTCAHIYYFLFIFLLILFYLFIYFWLQFWLAIIIIIIFIILGIPPSSLMSFLRKKRELSGGVLTDHDGPYVNEFVFFCFFFCFVFCFVFCFFFVFFYS